MRAVETAGEPFYFMDVSALSRRWTLLLPARPEVLAHVAPNLTLGALPTRPVIKVFGDGAHLHVAIGAIGSVAPSAAVEVAPETARASWLETVTAMHAFGNGAITSRLQFLDQPRGTIDVLYPARAAADDARFTASLDQIAWRVGVSSAQRELAKTLRSSANGAAVVVTTACEGSGPAPELHLMSGTTDWDEAVRLCRLVASEDAARGGAAMLGMLAGTLEAEQTAGVQVQLRPDGTDVSVLVSLR
jgi:hypothetical protein